MGASPNFRLTLDQYKNKLKYFYGKFADEFFRLYPATDDASACNKYFLN
jgi:hypothetical protein